MRALVTGATGFIGSRLVGELDRPVILSRRPEEARKILGAAEVHAWNPEESPPPAEAFEGVEAIFHLAGDSVASGRWTAAKKARIRRSRVEGTALLARTLASLDRPPAVLACASAIGYYGDRGDDALTEESPPGAGFLASVCRDWEAAATPAVEAGIRVLHLRFGVVLSAAGGALAKMLGPFRMGMGGPIGSGRQYVSWIAMDDVLEAINHLLSNPTLHGPVNVASPRPVTQLEFARTLGRVLGRPTVLAVPAFGMRLMFGEMATEVLLASQRLEPARLLSSGYEFRYPDLEPALRHLVGGG